MARKRAAKPRSRIIKVDPTLPVEPTDALPGSKARIEELAKRVAAGQVLFARGDVLEEEGRVVEYRKAGNGALVKTGQDVIVEEGKTKGRRRVRESNSTSTTQEMHIGQLLCPRGIGNKIRAARLRRRWSLGQLGIACGLCRQAIWLIEVGRRPNPCIFSIWAIADALGLPIDDLIGREIV